MRLAHEMASRGVEKFPQSACRLGALIFLWLILIVGGFYFLESYNSRPGKSASPPLQWPRNEILSSTPGKSSMLIFLHPMCPCSNATMTELQEILATPGNDVHPIFVMMMPEEADPSWKNAPLVRSALETPNGKVIFSKNGDLENLFSVHTSGQILFYNELGRLVFSGGITPARGEQGENAGSFQLKKNLSDSSSQSVARSMVYGCPLAPEIPPKNNP